MRLPFDGSYGTTQGFGENPAVYQRFGINGHNGIDYALPTGTSVLAVEAGIASVMEDPGGYGHFVRVVGRYQIDYGHLQRAVIASGTHVGEGQQIATSNNSGNSTGPHLHITVKPIPADKSNGYFGAIDPLRVLNNQGGEEVITDVDNEYFRWNKLGVQIRGRELSREEFRQAAVGRTWLQAMEILSDDQEADAATDFQNWGRTAKTDRWDLQIAGLQTKVSDLTEQGQSQQKTITALNKQIEIDKTALQAAQAAPVVQPPTSTPLVPATPSASPGVVVSPNMGKQLRDFFGTTQGRAVLGVAATVVTPIVMALQNFQTDNAVLAAAVLAAITLLNTVKDALNPNVPNK